MTEDYLHYIWKFQKFDKTSLKTKGGDKVVVVYPGQHNKDAGADFQAAKLHIGEQLWAGAVEIHIRSSDWFKHKHEDDEAYKNVVLHVVYEDDLSAEEQPLNGSLPVLELKSLFDEYGYWRYEQLIGQEGHIPCHVQFAEVDELYKNQMLDRVLIERLEEKQQLVLNALTYRENDWEAAFFDYTAYGFGLKVNAEPMQQLARLLHPKLFNHYAFADKSIEALVFGTSGLLEKRTGAYADELKKEYNFLTKKHHLQHTNASIWKFSRLMPTAFPPIRLAQWSRLWQINGQLFSKVIKCGDINEVKKIFRQEPLPYWQEHYDFEKPSKRKISAAGNDLIERVIINVVVPFLFAYGRQKGEFFYEQRALDLLDQLSAEANKITRLYKQLGVKAGSAAESQAQVQWFKKYCAAKKCLNCAVGNAILKI